MNTRIRVSPDYMALRAPFGDYTARLTDRRISCLFQGPKHPRAKCDNPGVARTRDLETRLEHTEKQLHLLQQISLFMVRDMPLN